MHQGRAYNGGGRRVGHRVGGRAPFPTLEKAPKLLQKLMKKLQLLGKICRFFIILIKILQYFSKLFENLLAFR